MHHLTFAFYIYISSISVSNFISMCSFHFLFPSYLMCYLISLFFLFSEILFPCLFSFLYSLFLHYRILFDTHFITTDENKHDLHLLFFLQNFIVVFPFHLIFILHIQFRSSILHICFFAPILSSLSHIQLATHVIIGLEEPQRKINTI